MGKMNLLRASWEGKVGQTVGSKWKNLATIRTYSKPTYTDTPAQQDVRTCFRELNAFLARFTQELKSYSALNTKGMSLRNALVKLNKLDFQSGGFDPSTLILSKGGLPNPGTPAMTVNATTGVGTYTYTEVVNPLLSTKAKIVFVAVGQVTKRAEVITGLNNPIAQLSSQVDWTGESNVAVWAYLLDYRGSAKVAGNSVFFAATVS